MGEFHSYLNRHPEYYNEIPWLKEELTNKKKSIKPETKFENYRYIGRLLPPSYEVECLHCSWTGPVQDTTTIENSPTPEMIQKMGTTQMTEVDLYCPSCGSHIISCAKLDNDEFNEKDF